MNTKTKTLLGLAVVAGVGYLLYKRSKEKSEPKNFANFVKSDKPQLTAKCKGDYGKDAEGRYICCRPGFRSTQTDGTPCADVL